MADNKLDPGHLFEHVQDATYFELPRWLGGRIEIPDVLGLDKPIWEPNTGNELLDNIIQPLDLRLTKFMVLEVVAAVILCILFIRLAHRMRGGHHPRGLMWNLLESMVVFIRDQVARPAIGKQDADRFVPLLWTIFFFVLACNLMGMIPWLGSPTGALATTLALAMVTFLTVIGAGMAKLGVVGFFKAQVPHMDLPLPIAVVLVPIIFVIEIFGLVIKHFVLAVRLLANMMAGHVVLAVIVAFIAVTADLGTATWLGVTSASVVGAMALSLLELFVAFLQAYIFAFLSALFIGAAVHPH